MIKFFKRFWKYLGAGANQKFNEKADPKIQLEQAITEAQDQHRRLKEQAANVIANQKQTEMRLNRAMEELEKVNGNARQAVLMADEAAKKGDTAKAAEYTPAAEAFANRLGPLETRGRGPQDAAAAVRPGGRSGQGRGAAELGRPAAEAGRASEAASPARPGEDAGADEQGDGLALRDRRPGRADVRRGARQDRGPLRQGQGHVRAQPRPRSRAACSRSSRPVEHRGAGPAVQIRAQLGIAPAEPEAVGSGAGELGEGTPTATEATEPAAQPEAARPAGPAGRLTDPTTVRAGNGKRYDCVEFDSAGTTTRSSR